MNSKRKKWAFTENNCRICSKVFCCTSCRKKHEADAHKIFPECNICVIGNHLLSEVNESFLNHLKSSHWPLQCLYCNNQFSSVQELLNRKKCAVGFKKPSLDSPQTPCLPPNIKPMKIVLNDDENDSPLGLLTSENFENRLITSTPMQRGEVLNIEVLENIEIHITPVDYNNSDKKESIIKKKTNDNSENSSKRRVTFCDTPVIERESSKKNKMSNGLNKYPSLEEYPQDNQDQDAIKSEYPNEDNAQNKDSSTQKGSSLTESEGEVQSRLSWSLQEDNTESSSCGTFHSVGEPPASDDTSRKEYDFQEETDSNDSMKSVFKNLNQMCEEVLAAPESGIHSGIESEDYPINTDYYNPVLTQQINCEITSTSFKVEVKEDIKFCVTDTDDPQRQNVNSTIWESALNISISQDSENTGVDEEKENEGHIKICSVTPSKKILLEKNDTPEEHHVTPLPRTPLALLPESNLGTNTTNSEIGKKSNVIKVRPLSQLQMRTRDFSSESLPNNTKDESTNKDEHETPENAIPTYKPSVSVKPLAIQNLVSAEDNTDSSASSVDLSNLKEDSLDDSLTESNQSQSLESSTEANTSIWPRVSRIVKNSIQSLFSRSANDNSFDRSSSLKRHLSDSSYEFPVKRQKLVDVKCRPLIRPISYLFNEQSSSESIDVKPQANAETVDVKPVKPQVKYVDKATQTELTFYISH